MRRMPGCSVPQVISKNDILCWQDEESRLTIERLEYHGVLKALEEGQY
jgi:hypothetical protein